MTSENKGLPVVDRRQMLLMGATGMMTLVGLFGKNERQVFAQNSVVSTPNLEEGPYWVDETGTAFHRSDVRANLDGTNVQVGLPLHLGLTVAQVINGVITPMPNAYVYIWSCNALGVYSDEASENSSSDTYLRGYQVTNAHGNVQFTTLYSGWYSGRTPHIHIRVRLYGNGTSATPTYDFETQLFYDQALTTEVFHRVYPYTTRPVPDTLNSADRVYTGGSEDADGVTSYAGAVTTITAADDMAYAVGSFRLILNTSLTETTGNGGGGGGGTPPGGGGGGMPPGGGGGMPPGGGGGAPPGG